MRLYITDGDALDQGLQTLQRGQIPTPASVTSGASEMAANTQILELAQRLHLFAVVQIAVDGACRFQTEAFADQLVTLVTDNQIPASD